MTDDKKVGGFVSLVEAALGPPPWPAESAAAQLNTDRELYREPDQGKGSYYSDSIHVTKNGAIGINHAGHVIVMTLRNWFFAARSRGWQEIGKPPAQPVGVELYYAGLVLRDQYGNPATDPPWRDVKRALGYWDGDRFRELLSGHDVFEPEAMYQPTHWRPLPDPPRNGEQDQR